MDITAFKKALKAGDVAFSYKKKDGTIREAHGTLCEKLLPKTAPVVKFKCKNINWDTDGRGQCGLPDKMTIEFDEAWYNEALAAGANKFNIEDCITEELVSKTGFAVLDFEYKCLEKRAQKKLPEGTIFYYDIAKAGYRSFNESQLIDWKEFVK